MFLRIMIAILLCSPLWGVDRERLARMQFPNNNISPYLKAKVPFLSQPFETMNQKKITVDNFHTLNFQPNENQMPVFSAITGFSVYNTRFVVSWYMFSDSKKIPESNTEIMSLLNKQKPLRFSFLTYTDNDLWVARENLPYKEEHWTYAYISIINESGVLLPLAGQSFYEDYINKRDIKEKTVSFNTDILLYWDKSGYF